MPKKLPVDLSKVFNDKTGFPDDYSITLPNGAELTMADLRAWNEESGGALKAEMAKVSKEWDKIKAEQEKVTKASQSVAQMFLDLEEQKKQLAHQPQGHRADPFDELVESDPLAKHVKAIRDEVKAQMDALREENKKLYKSMGQMGQTYMNDLARAEFDHLRNDPDFSSDLTLEGVFDYAVKQGIKRSDGIPDVKRAYEQLTAPKRQERLTKEAVSKAREQWEEEAKKSALGMPPKGMPNQGFGPMRGPSSVGDMNKPPRNLREAIARGAQDPTIFGFQAEGEA